VASQFETLWRDQAVEALLSLFGETFILRRGTDTAELTAEIAAHEEVESEDRGFRQTWRGLKLTLRAADYLVAGLGVAPAKGDRFVKYLDDGTALVYTALPPKSKPVYEKIGDGYELLVYAKETGTE